MVWACAAHAQDTGTSQPDLDTDTSSPSWTPAPVNPSWTPAPASPSLDTSASQLKFHAKFNAEAFVSLFDVREDSVFNPGNVLARQPERQFDTLFAPSLPSTISGCTPG